MNAQFDKCIIVRNNEGIITNIIVQDVMSRKKIFLSTTEMDMDEILELVVGRPIDVAPAYEKL